MSPWEEGGQLEARARDTGLERQEVYEQFWPSTLEMEAMFPAPKAAAGLAKATKAIRPNSRPGFQRLGMMGCSKLWFVAVSRMAGGMIGDFKCEMLRRFDDG